MPNEQIHFQLYPSKNRAHWYGDGEWRQNSVRLSVYARLILKKECNLRTLEVTISIQKLVGDGFLFQEYLLDVVAGQLKATPSSPYSKDYGSTSLSLQASSEDPVFQNNLLQGGFLRIEQDEIQPLGDE